jgi:hypothetical protein
MKLTLASLTLILIVFTTNGQKRKNYFPIWTYHQRNINIHGVSLGIGSVRGEPRNTNTNGIKVELIGAGLAVPLIPRSPIATNDSSFIDEINVDVSERINGLNISASGTVCDCVTNGITVGFLGQINLRVRGVSGAFIMNFTQSIAGVHAAIIMTESYQLNGVQISAFNEGHRLNGLQIGVFNKSTTLKGIQIGLWNVNQKRKLPFINWSFKT